MKFTYWVWYTKTYEDGFQGADIKDDFKDLAEAWNYYNEYKAEHPDDYNLMLCVNGVAIAAAKEAQK